MINPALLLKGTHGGPLWQPLPMCCWRGQVGCRPLGPQVLWLESVGACRHFQSLVLVLCVTPVFIDFFFAVRAWMVGKEREIWRNPAMGRGVRTRWILVEGV